MSSNFSSALQKPSKRILKKIENHPLFFLEANSRTIRRTWTERYQNISLSLVRNGGCLKMPGDEQKKKSKTMLGRPFSISSTMSLQTMYLTNYDVERDK